MKSAPKNLADLETVKKLFGEFVETIAALRNPETGCPWDLQQDHETLRKYMIEEAYEAVAEMSPDASTELADELGDVLLQVVLNAQVAEDDQRFSIEDVVRSIKEKMIRRHPHVFGSSEQRKRREVSQIKEEWQRIKAAEQGESQTKSVFKSSKVQKTHPATSQAARIGEVSSTIDFDWSSPLEVFEHLKSEVQELGEEINKTDDSPVSRASLLDELGDVYFTLAQVSRHLGFDPEVAAQRGNDKFLNRFAEVEKKAAQSGEEVLSCGGAILNRIWNDIKVKN